MSVHVLFAYFAMQELNLSQLVAQELRAQGNKSVKSLYWNSDSGNLSVFARSHSPQAPVSFNFAPDPDLSVEEIAKIVEERCALLNEKHNHDDTTNG